MNSMNSWNEFSRFALLPWSGYPAANDPHFTKPRLGGEILAALRAVAQRIDSGLLEPLFLASRQAQLYRELEWLSDCGRADIGLKRSDIAAVVYGSFPVKAALKNVAVVAGKTVANDQVPHEANVAA